jgi:hypothetical protein
MVALAERVVKVQKGCHGRCHDEDADHVQICNALYILVLGKQKLQDGRLYTLDAAYWYLNLLYVGKKEKITF